MLKHLKVFQLNCRKSGEVLTAAMESGVELEADLVLIQEPPTFQGWRHPAFDFIWGGRVLTGVRKDSVWTIRVREDLG